MASKKNYWYVIVMTNNGAVFVTSTNNFERVAYWDKDKAPKEMNKSDAQYLATALTINGHLSYAVCQTWQIDNQPYLYQTGEFKWINKEVENG